MVSCDLQFNPSISCPNPPRVLSSVNCRDWIETFGWSTTYSGTLQWSLGVAPFCSFLNGHQLQFSSELSMFSPFLRKPLGCQFRFSGITSCLSSSGFKERHRLPRNGGFCQQFRQLGLNNQTLLSTQLFPWRFSLLTSHVLRKKTPNTVHLPQLKFCLEV